MITPLPPWLILDPLIEQWLREDWGRGDRTSAGLFLTHNPTVQGQIFLKEAGLICGLPLAARIFAKVGCTLTPTVAEGSLCTARTIIAKVTGTAQEVLMAERVALNILQRLSGISTLTDHYVTGLKNTPVRLTDTRKTTPGLRILEKYATHCGGAVNHRFGLDDAVLIKDNHISAAGGVTAAIERIREHLTHLMPIEIECETLSQVQEAFTVGVDMILLDNMTPEDLTICAQWIQRRVPLEASGNITLENLAQVAQTGVQFIATSAPITRSRWLDISLDLR